MNYKKKICRYSIYILSILLTGCSTSASCSTPATPTPIPLPSSLRFVNHIRPQGDTSFQSFDDAGCPPDEYDFRKCREDSPLFALGCDEIQEPSDLLGSLEPAYPIAFCLTRLYNVSGEVNKIHKAYQNQCETSPNNICSNIDSMTDTCAPRFSEVCKVYYEAVKRKCTESPENICDLLGIYETTSDIHDKVYGVEHISMGDYSYSSEGRYFFRSGGLLPVLFRYVILKDNDFVLVETEDEFREIFVPIETPEEALGYVKAVTGLKDYYGLPNPRHKYLVADVIEDTYGKMVEDGYLVHLYYTEVFGCGSHPTFSVDFHITSQGYIQQLGTEKVFADPSQDGLCVD